MTSLSVVIPTFNERENIRPLAERLLSVLSKAKIDAELIVVDDNSPDGTAELAQLLAESKPLRVILRKEKHGLGSAILDGIHAAQSPIICVMDADLSHPPEAVPEMYKIIKSGTAQLVIGSRVVPQGGTSKWIWYRKFIHWVARSLGSFLTPIKDITSGFFMFDKNIIQGIKLESRSWKIALEIIVKGKYLHAEEYPIVFVEREAGKSKMRMREIFSYLGHLLALSIYKLSRR